MIKTKNKEAIQLATANNLRGAADIFEEIVQLSPKDSQYLNNLGVTYMRLALYHLAEQTLRRARRADPTDPDPMSNLKELNNYLPDSLPFPDHDPQLHTTNKCIRIPYADFHLPKYEQYRRGQSPFVLTGAIDHWTNAFDNWSLEYFMHKYPKTRVEHYSRSMVHENVKPIFMKIERAHADMTAQSKWYKDKPGVYVQWNLNAQQWTEILEDATRDVDTGATSDPKLPAVFASDDVWLDQCFDNNKDDVDGFLIGTHWRMLLIGSDHAGMFNHRDILRSSSFQAQLVGSKRWHLCGPSEDSSMYAAGDINTFSPDYEKFPNTKEAHCIDDWVEPGEMIFYGRDWWHHTEVKSDPEDGRPSVAITGTLIDENNYDGMIKELSRECGLDLADGTKTSAKNKRIHLPEGTCQKLATCFVTWERDWGAERIKREEEEQASKKEEEDDDDNWGEEVEEEEEEEEESEEERDWEEM